MSAGALKSAIAGDVPRIFPMTIANSATRKSSFSRVAILYRVQSENLRCDHRLKRPNTRSDQNRL
jgi:hypothetical protein